MSWEKFFLVDRQLRPIWRFFLSIAMIPLAGACAHAILLLLVRILGHPPQFFVTNLCGGLLMLAALLGGFRILTGILEEKPLGSIGLAFHGRWKMEFGRGVGVGALMILLVASLEYFLGLAKFDRNGLRPGELLSGGFIALVSLAVAATNEEMVFRGYPFQRLVEVSGPLGAVVISSVLFGLVHLGNPHHTWISTLNTMLVGVPLAAAYLRTRMLWLPIGLHLTWNFLLGFALGLPVSGFVFPEVLLKPQVSEMRWLTGGSYGPEGSILATGVIVLATLYIMFSRRIYITEETRELVFGQGPAMSGPIKALAVTTDSRNASNIQRIGSD